MDFLPRGTYSNQAAPGINFPHRTLQRKRRFSGLTSEGFSAHNSILI
jgi:hypothetical protein